MVPDDDSAIEFFVGTLGVDLVEDSPSLTNETGHPPAGRTAVPARAYGVLMLVAFSVAPSVAADSTGSVSESVAAAVKVVRESGLPNRTDSMFTTVEGEWDECMAVVKRCVETVAAYGPRVSLVLKADIREGYSGEMTGKLERLESAIDKQG